MWFYRMGNEISMITPICQVKIDMVVWHDIETMNDKKYTTLSELVYGFMSMELVWLPMLLLIDNV